MQSRHLFLIGYDVRQNPTRQRVLRDVQKHALGGQKSFYECWLSVGELQTLLVELSSRIDSEVDRIVIVRLDGRTESIHLGAAEVIPSDDYFLIT